MKYISLLSFTILMVGCSSTGSVTPESTTGETEAATSSGIDGVYSGGGSYDPDSGLYDASGSVYGTDANGKVISGNAGNGSYAAPIGSYNPGAAAGYNPASNSDHYNNPAYGENVAGGPKAQAKDRIIYFAYDSSRIDNRAESIVQQHAAYLKSHPNVRILLEGHTDHRGSREYNIALGERRAISVLKRFQTLGVPVSQIRIISYGEENPAVNGYNESAYQRNRRAVIQY